MGKGGRRPGAGRKPKGLHLVGLDGGASHSRLAPQVVQPTAPIDRFDPPPDLAPEVLTVWQQLAPYAFEQRTLVPATTESFVLLCRNVVLERLLSVKQPGTAAHRGMIQRVDTELLRFNLSPCGKPLYSAQREQKPVNPLERFR